MLALALAILATSPTMAGPSVAARESGAAVPAPFFTLLTSNPAAECDGAALSGITHTNATVTRYCEKSDGTLVSIAANAPRVSNKGVLVEGSRAGLLLQYNAQDNAAWTATNVFVTANGMADPASGATAEAFGTNSPGGYLANTTAIVPSQTTGTVSVWLADTGPVESPVIVVRDTTAGADRATCNLTTPGDAAWHRYHCNVTGMTGANNHVVRFYPGGLAGDTNDTMGIWGPMLSVPLANFATSTIASVATAITRANDVYTWSNATDISTAGCLSATVTFGQSAQFGGSILSNSTEAMMATTNSTSVRINDGTNTVTATVPDLTGRTVNILTKWSGSTMTVIADGVTASGAFDGSFSSTAVMRLGATSAGSGYCNCHIDNIKAGANPESCN